MDIEQKEISLKFYSFLCDVIGTKHVVKKRRQIFAIRENCGQIGGNLTVSSGSKAEGLDLKGSDFDEMFVFRYAHVFEQLDHVKNSDDNHSLIMNTENVKTGYSKLWVHHLPSDDSLSDCIDLRTGRPYLSSRLFRESSCDMMLQFDPGFYVHGPCTASNDGMVDSAICFHCTYWISQALPWINRTKYSWASDEVIQNILCSGVLFVPIGSKNSPDNDLEWRISFSYAEKQLIFCFNHIQLLCYALLKIILKDIIQKEFGDLLCSYFMKTIMFWLCEETDVKLWRKENVLLCFMTCFRRLIYCVENETCLHYFIPENNLFENRFEKQHNNLLARLQGLYNSGWTFLLQAETLQLFSSYLQPSLFSNITLSTFFPCLKFLHNFSSWHEFFNDEAALINICTFRSIRSKEKRDLNMFVLSSMCQYFGQNICDKELVEGNNKVIYGNLRRSLSNLLIGVNHDAVSGWLLLASFFFTIKQYKISKILIDYSLTKFNTENCELFRENNLSQLRYFVEIQNIIGFRCLKNYTIDWVLIQKNSGIIPDELKSGKEKDKIKVIPSIVYAYVLKCLFYHTIGDTREMITSYNILKFLEERYKQCVWFW